MRKCTIVHIPTVQRQLDLKYSFEKTLSHELIVSLNALNPVSLTVFQQKRRRIETKEYYIQSGVGVAFVHVLGSERLDGLLVESGTAFIAIFQNSSCQGAQPDRFRIQFNTKRCENYCNYPILKQEIAITEYQIYKEYNIYCDYPIFGQQFPQGTGATKLLPGHLK